MGSEREREREREIKKKKCKAMVLSLRGVNTKEVCKGGERCVVMSRGRMAGNRNLLAPPPPPHHHGKAEKNKDVR